MPADILGELLDRGVPAFGLLAKRHQHNVVEVACKLPPQLRKVRAARCSNRRCRDINTGSRGLSGYLASCERRAESGGFRTADDSGQLVELPRIDFVRAATREKQVEDDAERIDIGGCAGRGAGDLFRACEFGRQDAQHRHRKLISIAVGILGKNLRNSEIEQLRRPISRDENVRGLQVAVHHQLAMCVSHGGADAKEQPEAVADGQPVRIAVSVDRLPFDQLHHKVGQAFRCGAAIDEPGYVGMLQIGQDLAFGAETRDRKRGLETALHHFDRNLLAVFVVCAHGAKNRAHAAFADLLGDLVGAQPATDPRLLNGNAAPQILAQLRSRLQEATGLVIGANERIDISSQRRFRAGSAEKLIPLVDGQFECPIDHVPHLDPREHRYLGPWALIS